MKNGSNTDFPCPLAAQTTVFVNPHADFDVMGDFSPVILIKDKDGSYHHNGEEDKNGVTQRIIYGNIDTVLSTPGDEVNVLHMSKGETRTLTYGIVVDDDVLDNA